MKVATWGVCNAAGCLGVFHSELGALTIAAQASNGCVAKPLIVLPDNLMSHKAALRYVATSVHTEDDRDYWQHELNAMQTMYKELEK